MSILATKLYIPPVPAEWISRPRLLARLDAGLHCKLTVVSAAAGFGKTTLLSEWTHQRLLNSSHAQPHISWVSLDRDDSEPTRFWTYFIAALQTVSPELGKPCLAMLDSPNPSPIRSILTMLSNDIAKEPGPLVLVLDDYHVIELGAIHEDMMFLIDHLPPQLHIIISSRIDPTLPLAGLRGRGQLNEIRTADLRFTQDEVAAFFNRVMHFDLSDENVIALEERTEGWIASLKMAAISMRGCSDTTDFIKAFSGTHHYIMDYLVEEVLHRQEEDMQRFLLQTSILDRMCAPLCNAVTGGDDGQEKLEHLGSANLFVIPLDDNRRWFRYHRLFADLLRNRLNTTQPELVSALHLRASRWFESEDLMDESIEHALTAQDFERAADLIQAIAIPLMSSGRLSIWLSRLPSESVRSRPWLCVSLAGVYVSSARIDGVQPLLDAAESALSAVELGQQCMIPSEERTLIRNHVQGIRSILALLRGDIASAIELCNEISPQLLKDQPSSRSLIMLCLGTAHWAKGELATAASYFDEAIALGQAVSNYFIAMMSMGFLANIEAWQGKLRKSAETSRQAIRLSTEWGGGEPVVATSYAHASLAQVLYQWNEINDAVHHVNLAVELDKRAPESSISLPSLATFPNLWMLTGVVGESSPITKALEETTLNTSFFGTQLVSDVANAWRARVSISHGDLPSASRWLASHEPEVSLHDIPDFYHEAWYLTLVRLNIAQGNVDNIPGLLDGWRRLAEAQERTGGVIEILVLQSLALQAQNNLDQALIILKQALSLAESEGYVRIFVDEGIPMRDLLRQALSRGIASAYVNKLLAAFDVADSIHADVTPAARRQHGLAEPLSERELEVLRLIAAGKSNSQIAEQLVVGISTAKTHINNLYSKLGIHSRTQAVARARELGLI